MNGFTALRLLNEAGYEAYFVGGSVRDGIIEGLTMAVSAYRFETGDEDKERNPNHKSPKAVSMPKLQDIDITTNALPEQVKRVFSEMKVIDTGIKHGTVTVLLPAEGNMESLVSERSSADVSSGNQGEVWHTGNRDEVRSESLRPDDGGADEAAADHSGFIAAEITTYRTEAGYSDGRHPDSVAFTPSITEDLKRRDFTMNAIAQDSSGKIIDPFGGADDIKNRIIRAVGDPDERFAEDALRIMRALRFASVLGFEIEKETEAALFRNSHMLKMISAERIFSEFKKLAVGQNAGSVVRKYVDILGVVIPELSAMKGFEQHNAYHKYDVLEHCIRAMEAVNTTDENRLHMKIAALFHDIGKPLTYSPDDKGRGHFYGHAAKSRELTDVIMKRFRADKALTERVGVLVKYHDLIFEKDARLLKKWMNRFTPEVLFEILEIKRADNFATGNMSEELRLKFEEIGAMMEEIVGQGQCFSLKELAVNGQDIMTLGVEKGPQVGELLDFLLNAVIDGSVSNDRKQLMEMAAMYISKSGGDVSGKR